MKPVFRLQRRHWAGLLVSATVASGALLSGQAFADDALAVKTLTEQARFWESKGRTELAAAAWKRLLQIDPKNPDALAGLAQTELANNRPEAAKALG